MENGWMTGWMDGHSLATMLLTILFAIPSTSVGQRNSCPSGPLLGLVVVPIFDH